MSDDDCVQDIGILQRDETGVPLTAKPQTAPARQKVAAFKNRVFSLLTLFVEKSKDPSPLIPLLTGQLFAKQPEKLRQLLTSLLNRSALSQEQLLQVAQYYKSLLLYKGKKDVQKFSEDFIKILRKINVDEPQTVKAYGQEMLQVFITKRKCRLSFSFFPFLLKKMPTLRPTLTATATSLATRGDIRPAQQRVLQKLLKSLTRPQTVKQEHTE